ncbi:MAG: SPFH domain-containing protein [Bacilli bacterium]|nr:SPFH domain-containing protein [Bacilli bacterium]
MGLFKNNKKVGLISDIIRCDEPSYLIWKWHPDGTQPGEHKREYAIRWGSSLRVKDGEVAVFVYKQKDGTMQDYIVGPYDEKIKTANFPILSGIIGAAFGGDTPFQAEVYFINLANVIQVRFGIPFFDVSDPRYPDFAVPVAVRGTISFKIDNYREFIKLHRLQTFNLDDFQRQVRDAVSRYVKDAVTNAPATHNIPVIQIESKTAMVNDVVELNVKDRLKETFGVVVSGVDISAIEVDKSSIGYQQLKSITVDVTTATIHAQTGANIEHYSETLRIQREEGQYAQHMGTQTANIGAFQIEKQAEVGVAGAQALGQIGANGAGNVDLGGGGGFNPAAMMASVAVGGVVGQNIASVMGNVMPSGGAATPPPIPVVAYNVAKDGASTGPFDIATLTTMAAAGTLKPDSLVWKVGMAAWARADSVDDLKGLFAPPVPPIV